MLTDDGRPKVTDFGLAMQTDGTTMHTATGAIMGTPAYMAPEQAAGETSKVGPATDVYALGVILFELLTGKTPYNGPLLQMLSQIASAPVPSVRDHRSDLDESLNRVCRIVLGRV